MALQPKDLLDRSVPDLTLPGTLDAEFPLRSRVGHGPLVLFFFIHGGTPG